jgi:hypothetical protein
VVAVVVVVVVGVALLPGLAAFELEWDDGWDDGAGCEFCTCPVS